MPKQKNKKLLIVIIVIILAVIGIISSLIILLNKDDDSVDTQGIIVNSIVVNGVHAIEYYDKTEGKKPLLIAQHGLTGESKDFAQIAVAFAKQGMYVVTPDAYGHGANQDDVPKSTMEIIVATSNAFVDFVDYYKDSSIADTSRLGLLGFSLGGFASYYYTANEEITPKAIVSICATPTWDDMTAIDIMHKTYNKGELQNIIDEDEIKRIDSYIIAHSPYNSLLENEYTSFYMINGALDELIPLDGVEKFYNEFSIDSSDRVKLEINQELGHTVSEQNLWDALEFLYYNLQ